MIVNNAAIDIYLSKLNKTATQKQQIDWYL